MSEQSFSESMERGLAAHREGRMADALVEYRAALSIKPQDAEALSLMGLALMHGGRTNEALILLGRAVDIEPRTAGFRVNLAEGFARAGQNSRALQEFRAVTELQPDHVHAWDRSGDLAALLGDQAAAVDGWGRAYLVDYRSIESALKIARLEIARGRVDVASNLIDSVLSRSPTEPRTLAIKCQLLESRRDWQALADVSATWTRARPEDAEGWRSAARAAFERGRHVEAVTAFKRSLALSQPTAADWYALSGLCMHAMDLASAAEALDKAETLAAPTSETLARRAMLLMYDGQFARAEEHCRRALALDAGNVSAITTLSRLRSGRMSDAELQMVASLSRRPDLDAETRIAASVAVAHAHDARGEIDAAFRAYSDTHEIALNRDQAVGRAYDRVFVEKRAERIIELSRITLPSMTPLDGAMRPIFVVGMPRSGTTLIESVLSVHSRVFAVGERSTMQQILRACLELDVRGAVPDAEILRSWIQAYLTGFPVTAAKDHLTDKHPLNFEAVGIIAALFPEARIVHVRRNPLETGLAIFRQESEKPWSFAHRLEDIGHFYGVYARLATHWEQHLPGRFVTLQYEQFVADFETEARRLVEGCGLGWETACLDFQDVSRQIATGSGVARYAQYLDPLVGELKRARVNLETGALDPLP
ncbi:tetratricopeptide (TPR) repeat protein [Povalibacter uvarum]|uniref:Tetratricopeptide (TPR) repeat protein n=1 Tax=Povalibacter uvarum TaxID=732238 RepID=A0A841HNC9_9GAMM|nr:tetratricopeptide repeat-containing sulfotransferase family protein [Povalibacter uvarum]MBB6093668.1 tetratricopeptide (TPR) repeat protein [Povalibacter uvarum]